MHRAQGTRSNQVTRWWRSWRLAGIAVGLMLVEGMLVGGVGPPVALARTLRDLGDPWAAPVVSMLALMALLTETLVGYLLLVLALRSFNTLPGLTGRVARRITLAISPAVVRRFVDLLVGGTLLVQVTLSAPGLAPGHRSNGSREPVAAALALGRSDATPPPELALVSAEAGQGRRPPDQHEPVEARPILRRSAVPLPPWLGDGPSKTAPERRAGTAEHTVEAGDTLWDIAAAHLVPAERSAATIHRYWRHVYRANRLVVGADPDVILPGTRLVVVPFRRDRP
jgi:LysM domain